MCHDVTEGGHVAAADCVQPVDPRGRLQRGELQFAGGFGPSGDGEPAQPYGEGQLEQQAREEHRRCVAKDRKDAQHGVGCFVAAVRRDHAERNTHQQCYQQRIDGQFKGGGTVGGQHLRDLAVVRERRAEIAGQQLPEVLEVLHEDRTVVACRRDPFGQLLGRKPPAERGGNRITGDPHQEEHHRDQNQDGWKDQEEPDQDVLAQSPAGRLLL
ncbi:hypothetical protein D9M72_469370 [compost metagenome]